MSEANDTLIRDLFEEVIDMAHEEGHTKDMPAFLSYVEQMLPVDVLDRLQEVLGDDVSFIEDVWMERFHQSPIEEKHVPDDLIGPRCCECCERKVNLTRHHVYPRETHTKLKKKGISSDELSTTIAICRLCHSTIHRFFTNDELAKDFNSLEKLLSNEKFFSFAKWASKLKSGENGRGR